MYRLHILDFITASISNIMTLYFLYNSCHYF